MKTKAKQKERKQKDVEIKKARNNDEYEQMLIDFVKDSFKEVF